MMREVIRTLAIDVCDVSATNAAPPSRAARDSRTISVPAGSDPVVEVGAAISKNDGHG